MSRWNYELDFDDSEQFEPMRTKASKIRSRDRRGFSQPWTKRSKISNDPIDALANKLEGIDSIFLAGSSMGLLRFSALNIQQSNEYDDVMGPFTNERTFDRLQETVEIEYITLLSEQT